MAMSDTQDHNQFALENLLLIENLCKGAISTEPIGSTKYKLIQRTQQKAKGQIQVIYERLRATNKTIGSNG